MNKARNNYLKQEVEGATPGKLVLMLYDGTIRFMKQAVKAIDSKDIEGAHNNIIKAENIIYELMSTLNMDVGGELSENLLRLYEYSVWELIHANNTKDKSRVENVINIILPLRNAWKQAVAKEENTAKTVEQPASINFAG